MRSFVFIIIKSSIRSAGISNIIIVLLNEFKTEMLEKITPLTIFECYVWSNGLFWNFNKVPENNENHPICLEETEDMGLSGILAR